MSLVINRRRRTSGLVVVNAAFLNDSDDLRRIELPFRLIRGQLLLFTARLGNVECGSDDSHEDHLADGLTLEYLHLGAVQIADVEDDLL